MGIVELMVEQKKEEAREEVREEGKVDVAKTMLREGFSVPDIAKATSLSEEEISKLKSKMDKENLR